MPATLAAVTALLLVGASIATFPAVLLRLLALHLRSTAGLTPVGSAVLSAALLTSLLLLASVALWASLLLLASVALLTSLLLASVALLTSLLLVSVALLTSLLLLALITSLLWPSSIPPLLVLSLLAPALSLVALLTTRRLLAPSLLLLLAAKLRSFAPVLTGRSPCDTAVLEVRLVGYVGFELTASVFPPFATGPLAPSLTLSSLLALPFVSLLTSGFLLTASFASWLSTARASLGLSTVLLLASSPLHRLLALLATSLATLLGLASVLLASSTELFVSLSPATLSWLLSSLTLSTLLGRRLLSTAFLPAVALLSFLAVSLLSLLIRHRLFASSTARRLLTLLALPAAVSVLSAGFAAVLERSVTNRVRFEALLAALVPLRAVGPFVSDRLVSSLLATVAAPATPLVAIAAGCFAAPLVTLAALTRVLGTPIARSSPVVSVVHTLVDRG